MKVKLSVYVVNKIHNFIKLIANFKKPNLGYDLLGNLAQIHGNTFKLNSSLYYVKVVTFSIF